MEPAAATDIDQRIATAVAAALAASRGAQAAAAPAAVNNVAVKLPEFWVADPDMWFMQAEAAFRTARINQSRTKIRPRADAPSRRRQHSPALHHHRRRQ